MYKKIPFKTLIRFFRYWPPFWGAGIKVVHLSGDKGDWGLRTVMPLKVSNRNYVGVHFGGSLYSMTDPFFMLILMNKLGNDYIVWDKAASIEFISPGRGEVFAEFWVSDERVESIKKQLEGEKKIFPEFECVVKSKEGETIARVHKTLYVRKK